MTTTNLSALAGQADPLRLYDETFASRLLLGTARYPSPQSLEDAVRVSNPAMLTVALRRQSAGSPEGGAGFWKMLRELGVPVLPNTAGCYSADEAYTLAQMSREVFETDWIKLEVIGDDYTLQPDTLALPAAAERLIKDGFKVLPYCTEDLVLCRRLLDVVVRHRPGNRAHARLFLACPALEVLHLADEVLRGHPRDVSRLGVPLPRHQVARPARVRDRDREPRQSRCRPASHGPALPMWCAWSR